MLDNVSMAIVRFVHEYNRIQGKPPTVKAAAELVGRNTLAVRNRVVALEKAGYIDQGYDLNHLYPGWRAEEVE